MTVVISVSSITDRDKMIKQIYTNLTSNKDRSLTIQQDQVNRIKVFHNVSKDDRVLVRTYLVIVIPITINLDILKCATGTVEFKLNETIESLHLLIAKLQSLNGRRVIKENKLNESTLTKLVGSLS
jgi:hypothetical protein